MKTRLSYPRLLIGLFVLAGAHATPLWGVVPSAPATPAVDTSETVPLTLALDNTPDVPVVLRVSRTLAADPALHGRDPAVVSAKRGDDLYVSVQDLEQWIAAAKAKGHGDKTDIVDLVLYLNGSPLPGVHPNPVVAFRENLGARPAGSGADVHADGRMGREMPAATAAHKVPEGEVVYTYRPVHYLHFCLDCTPESKSAWHQLLQRPDFTPRGLEVSVGFVDAPPMRTYVGGNGRQRFEIVTLPPLRFWGGVAVLFLSLALFLVLARSTDIIRDTNAPLRPDTRWPYSLARAQLACWFFLVLTSFVFLRVLTGEMDTFNTSVLALLGISAGTALGAAFIDSAGVAARPEDAGQDLAAVDLSLPKREILRQLERLLADAEERLKAVETERAAIDKDDAAALDKNGLGIKRAQDQFRTLKLQKEYFRQPAWKGVLYDLLAERGLVSFHRFQILVWTLVLGGLFVAGVYSETAMPEFNATLLGLLGISGGTYVGFKLPATQREG